MLQSKPGESVAALKTRALRADLGHSHLFLHVHDARRAPAPPQNTRDCAPIARKTIGDQRHRTADYQVITRLDPPPEGMAYFLEEPSEDGTIALVLIEQGEIGEGEVPPVTTPLSISDRDAVHSLHRPDPKLADINRANHRQRSGATDAGSDAPQSGGEAGQLAALNRANRSFWRRG